jgi:hypothetical protein
VFACLIYIALFLWVKEKTGALLCSFPFAMELLSGRGSQTKAFRADAFVDKLN